MITKKIEERVQKIILQNSNENSKETFNVQKIPTIILGLSGGPDSVFLFHILQQMHKNKQINLVAAHLDHEWRTDSKDDVQFCKNLCKQNNIVLHTTTAQNLKLNLKFNGSKEEIGRKLRRHFFEQIMKKEKGDYVALAHQKQDQQETFFIRMMRGSSIDGMTGIKELNGKYLRPMLDIDKKEIMQFLKNSKIDFIKDETNNSNRFLRNRIRKHVLPALKLCDARFDKKFESTLCNLQEAEKFLQKMTDQKYEKVFCENIGNLEFFKNTDKFLQKRLICKWLVEQRVNFNVSKSFLQEILHFLNSPRGGRHKITLNCTIAKKEKRFWIV